MKKDHNKGDQISHGTGYNNEYNQSRLNGQWLLIAGRINMKINQAIIMDVKKG